MVDGFKYGRGQDLTDYKDGTENPVGEEVVGAAIVAGCGAGLDGSSFVAAQQWAHDFEYFDTIGQDDKNNNIVGRRLSDNEELDNAPVCAHVKRTAAGQFEPRSVVLRRSMPWASDLPPLTPSSVCATAFWSGCAARRQAPSRPSR